MPNTIVKLTSEHNNSFLRVIKKRYDFIQTILSLQENL